MPGLAVGVLFVLPMALLDDSDVRIDMTGCESIADLCASDEWVRKKCTRTCNACETFRHGYERALAPRGRFIPNAEDRG